MLMTMSHAPIVTRDRALTIRLPRCDMAKSKSVTKVAELLVKSRLCAICFKPSVLMFWLMKGKYRAQSERHFKESVTVVPWLRFYRESQEPRGREA